MNDKQIIFKTIIILLAIYIALILPFVLLDKWGVDPNERITNIEPDIKFDGDAGYSEDIVDYVKLEAYTGLVFADRMLQDAVFYNDEANNYLLKVSLYLGDGTLIYESVMLNPGEEAKNVCLNQNLKAGIYKNSILCYKIYSIEDGSFINQCEFPIELNIGRKDL